MYKMSYRKYCITMISQVINLKKFYQMVSKDHRICQLVNHKNLILAATPYFYSYTQDLFDKEWCLSNLYETISYHEHNCTSKLNLLPSYYGIFNQGVHSVKLVSAQICVHNTRSYFLLCHIQQSPKYR